MKFHALLPPSTWDVSPRLSGDPTLEVVSLQHHGIQIRCHSITACAQVTLLPDGPSACVQGR